MDKTEVVRIFCSSCRRRISVEELQKGKAVSVGQYCFCPRCAGENLFKRIRNCEKLVPCEFKQECRQAT
jgi:hypothetical protein